MYKNAIRAAWAEINITNLDFNIKQIKEKLGPERKSPELSRPMLTGTVPLKLPPY